MLDKGVDEIVARSQKKNINQVKKNGRRHSYDTIVVKNHSENEKKFLTLAH